MVLMGIDDDTDGDIGGERVRGGERNTPPDNECEGEVRRVLRWCMW